MKNFKKNKPTMIRMFKLIQAICILYHNETKQTEADKITLFESIFKIAHIMAYKKDQYKNWIQDVLYLEKGLEKLNILKQIDDAYEKYLNEVENG